MTNTASPVEHLLRTDRLPHIWCPGCGIGTAFNAFLQGLLASGLPEEKVCVVSGIGCTGRVAGYVRLDSFHTTHGRAIPFATGLKLANPELTVVVVSGDGDLSAIGGNHLIHAARRNMDLKVICVNNFIYGMTGGQVTPTTPQTAIASTTPYGAYEPPFNLPRLVGSAGATYVARWTTFHIRPLVRSIQEALLHPGFSFIDVISCCPTLYARRNRLGSGRDMMKFFKEHSVINNTANLAELDIHFGEQIVVGKFIDMKQPTFLEYKSRQHALIQE